MIDTQKVRAAIDERLDFLSEGADTECMGIMREIRESIDVNERKFSTHIDELQIKVKQTIFDLISKKISTKLLDNFVSLLISKNELREATELLIDYSYEGSEEQVEYERLVRKYYRSLGDEAIQLQLIYKQDSAGINEIARELLADVKFLDAIYEMIATQAASYELPPEYLLSFIDTYFDDFDVNALQELVRSLDRNLKHGKGTRVSDIMLMDLIIIFAYKSLKRFVEETDALALVDRLKSIFRNNHTFHRLVCNDMTFGTRENENIKEKDYKNFLRDLAEGGIDARRFIQGKFGQAVVKFSESEKAKQELFEDADCLKVLEKPQAWITINDPKDAVELLDKVSAKSSKKDVIYRVISKFLGRPVRQLEDTDFRFYADEIIDGLNEFVGNSKLKEDEGIMAILKRCKFGFRYIRRTEDDLKMGSKTGDCTAPGSVNFENSLSWQVNPAYQVMKLQKGGRFLGRINLTLGKIVEDDCIFIDAVEFNPQAQEEGMPYYVDACLVFKEAIEHIRLNAKAEGRKVMLYQFSNSSDFETVLEKKGLELRDGPETMAPFTLVNAFEDVKRVLGKIGFDEKISLWYQMMDASIQGSASDSKDKIAARLEREVFNPGQIAHPEIAEAMRERNFYVAAGLFVQIYAVEIGKIFEIEGVGAELIKRKLGQLYKLSEGISGHRVVLNCSKFSEVL